MLDYSTLQILTMRIRKPFAGTYICHANVIGTCKAVRRNLEAAICRFRRMPEPQLLVLAFQRIVYYGALNGIMTDSLQAPSSP